MTTAMRDDTSSRRRLVSVSAPLSGSLVRLGDGRWLARHEGLNLYAYGSTGDEAVSRIHEAIDLLISSHIKLGGPTALRARFVRAGVEADIRDIGPEQQQRSITTLLSVARVLEY